MQVKIIVYEVDIYQVLFFKKQPPGKAHLWQYYLDRLQDIAEFSPTPEGLYISSKEDILTGIISYLFPNDITSITLEIGTNPKDVEDIISP